ncbi:DUF1642 domain-containing protein [Streptococcus suis]|uniref:DUF1642 domain-containing protein n=1 Tax=Streptococcus suis TaxID=1307 RepID=UPI002AACA0D5|nr:DUF1642 domain-containing protein [Streptococcus suis]MDY7304001.1 DUF1642 domain-containing protein [Streptococcus suis]
MNKQELEKQAEALYTDVRSFLDNTFELIDQIHEPQRVVVPKHIAEKIEYCKDTEGYGLFHAMDYCYQYKDSADWLECNEETFARAWLDGYEIEQEKLYTVEIPNPNRTTEPIIYLSRDEEGKIFLNNWFLHVSQNWKNQPHAHLTESEIKEDFEWAWQWAKPVEVE